MRYFILFFSFFLTLPVAAQDVYKTVDEDGNTIYTDQPPDDQARPMDLPAISVVDANRASAGSRDAAPNGSEPDPADAYGELEVLEPAPDQTYSGTGGTFVVRLQAAQGLSQGHKINYYINGLAAASTSAMVQLFSEVVRGEHQVRAEIVDAAGNLLVSSSSVTFHMQQQSALNPNNPANRQPSNLPARRPRG